MPVRPNFFDKRISLQKGCFTFHGLGKQQLTAKENSSLSTYLIPASTKNQIRKELALLRIDHFNIMGDLDSLARTLKENYKINGPRK